MPKTFSRSSGRVGLELLALVADEEVDGPPLRAVGPANGGDPRQDHLLLDVGEGAELADDVGGLVGQDAPDVLCNRGGS